jgi:hypothetical protein
MTFLRLHSEGKEGVSYYAGGDVERLIRRNRIWAYLNEVSPADRGISSLLLIGVSATGVANCSSQVGVCDYYSTTVKSTPGVP